MDKNDLWNVNVPDTVKGIKITRQGRAYVQDHFIQKEGDLWTQKGYMAYRKGEAKDTDIEAVEELDLVSITPMRCDRTEMDLYLKMKDEGILFQ